MVRSKSARTVASSACAAAVRAVAAQAADHAIVDAHGRARWFEAVCSTSALGIDDEVARQHADDGVRTAAKRHALPERVRRDS